MLGVCALAGCGDKIGMAVEITGPKTVANLDLYLSTGDCQDNGGCPGYIIPPQTGSGSGSNTRPRQPGDGWLVDTTDRYTVPVKDGKVTIQLQADDDSDRDVARALAIGYDDNGQVVAAATFGGFTIPINSSAIAKVSLLAADGDYGSTEKAEHLEIWPQRIDMTPPTLTECVLIQHDAPGGSGKNEFFVPSSDTDCDSVSHECNAWAYLYDNAPIGLAKSSCVTVDSSSGTCQIGGTACSETDPGQGSACEGVIMPTYCLPGALCPTTADSCPQIDETCLMPRTNDTTPQIDCGVGLTASVPCNSGQAMILAAPLVPETGTCKSIEIGVPAAPLAFDTMLDTGTGVTAQLDQFDEATCSVRITFSGTFTGAVSDSYALADIATETGAHRVVPLRLSYSTIDCSVGTPIDCMVVAGDGNDPLYGCH